MERSDQTHTFFTYDLQNFDRFPFSTASNPTSVGSLKPEKQQKRKE